MVGQSRRYTKPRVVLILLMAFACGLSRQGRAQEKPIWSDIDCSQSKLVTPAGLRCRSTQDYAGGQIQSSNGQGMFRRWAVVGTLNGVKLYYHLTEATGIRSSIRQDLSLENAIKSLSPEGKRAKDFSELTKRVGIDAMTFTSRDDKSCIGIHKFGPTTKTGYHWIMTATRCAAKGSATSDPEIDRFISAAGYRS